MGYIMFLKVKLWLFDYIEKVVLIVGLLSVYLEV